MSSISEDTMQTLLRDFRYALRQLRRAPGFAVTVVLTLALGIGATTAIFSCVYSLLLKSLPFRDEGSIVALAETNSGVKGGLEATYPDYLDWRAQQKSFDQVAAYSVINPTTVSLLVNGQPEQLRRVLASGNFFSLLGVSPLAGRLFDQQDDNPGKDHVAVISASAWATYFGRDPKAIGRAVTLNGTTYNIIGVLPQNAAFPADGEVWLPLSLLDQPTQQSRVWHSVRVLGRLRSGTTLNAARADMQTIAQRISATYPATNRNESVELTPLHTELVGSLRPAMLCLMGAVVLVLLVACANVANLLLVRATETRREIAVRQALGADRTRLLGQFLTQTVLLTLFGGLLGVALAATALPVIRIALAHTDGVDAALLQSINVNIPVLLFTLAICTVTAFLFGLLPATRTSKCASCRRSRQQRSPARTRRSCHRRNCDGRHRRFSQHARRPQFSKADGYRSRLPHRPPAQRRDNATHSAIRRYERAHQSLLRAGSRTNCAISRRHLCRHNHAGSPSAIASDDSLSNRGRSGTGSGHLPLRTDSLREPRLFPHDGHWVAQGT